MNTPQSPQPWWRFGHVWLIIAGPALVVVASFVTLYLALTRPDPLVETGSVRADPQAIRPGQQALKGAAMAPALQGRNHAATGVPVVPASGAVGQH